MSKQFLDCQNAIPVLKKVGREGLEDVFYDASIVTQQVLLFANPAVPELLEVRGNGEATST